MDFRMPVLDGTAALRLMRSIPDLKEVPVIALTAHALDEERCLPDDLLRAVEGVLAARRTAGA
jgi:CheY-like chemotaxis protein